MSSMPLRDTIGKCDGECRDRVLEGEMERQREIETSNVDYIEPSNSAKWTFSRTEQPGVYGGRV